MEIAIAGYGRMGALIRETALERGHRVPLIVDPHSDAAEVNARELTALPAPIDVIIDFSSPQTAVKNIERYGELGLAAVIGHDRMVRADGRGGRHRGAQRHRPDLGGQLFPGGEPLLRQGVGGGADEPLPV